MKNMPTYSREEILSREDTALLTTNEAALILNMTPGWFHQRAFEGNGIPFRKFGSRRLYMKSDVMAFIENATVYTSTHAYKLDKKKRENI